MTKTKRPQASQLDAFNTHFSSATRYGPDRWQQSLYPALAQPTRYTALYNRYAPLSDFHAAVGPPETLTRLPFPSAPSDLQTDNLICYIRKPEQAALPFPQPQKSSNGLLAHWNLDAASALAVHLLSPTPTDTILDLCASPGGKSLALAQSLFPHLQSNSPGPRLPPAKKAALHSNEHDRARFRRLQENLSAYLPSELISSGQVRALNLDATRGAQAFPLGAGGYDNVLVDAPCSSERHILHAHVRRQANQPVASELARWSPTGAKRMAEVQTQILLTAIRAVRVGGKVLYATCSISREENEGAVERVLAMLGKERARGSVRWTVRVRGFGEEVRRGLAEFGAEGAGVGWIVLPDRGGEWGPLFFCLLEKTEG